jgi:hypothetical protein
MGVLSKSDINTIRDRMALIESEIAKCNRSVSKVRELLGDESKLYTVIVTNVSAICSEVIEKLSARDIYNVPGDVQIKLLEENWPSDLSIFFSTMKVIEDEFFELYLLIGREACAMVSHTHFKFFTQSMRALPILMTSSDLNPTDSSDDGNAAEPFFKTTQKGEA